MIKALSARDQLDDLLRRTLRSGADAVDASISTSSSLLAEVRSGKLSGAEHEESQSVHLRAFIGSRQAHVSGSDLSPEGIAMLVERVCSMAAAAPEDPWCGLAAPEELEHNPQELELDGDPRPDFAILEERAKRAEAAALAVAGISQTEHVSAGWEQGETFMAASNGFAARSGETISSVSVVAIAGHGDKMERDYEVRAERKSGSLPEPEEIGRIAAERAIKRLEPRKLKSNIVNVIFDKRLSHDLLRIFAGAIAGPAIARGVSFLKDKLGSQVFAKGVNIIDEPLRRQGYGSRAFDGEGRKVQNQALIADGTLTQWLLSGPSARQLGLVPNGFASPGFGSPPGVSVSNLEMAPGAVTPEQLMRDAGSGILVTDMFGPSINPNNGDYSVGVSGFWFEHGQEQYPVSEVTLASDLLCVFLRAIPANDLELRGSVNAPSIMVEGMKLGGL